VTFRTEIIGDQTLILGDCRDVMPTLGRFDACVTDPPYGMNFQSNYREVQHSRIANDTNDDLLKWACDIPFAHSKYIFCRWDNLQKIPRPKSIIVWIKNNWSMGDLEHEHARQTEICLFWNGERHYFPKKRPTDILECARTGNIYHPTEKPLGLIKQIIEWTDGIVIDPFMGSGTTLVACQQLGRKGTGIEIREKYFDIACKRVEQAAAQPRLFTEPTQKPVQEEML